MTATVYRVDFRATNERNNILNKLNRLLQQDEFSTCISANDLTAIKLHFGEKGNDAFLNPIYLRPVVDFVKSKNGLPFLTDTNTLYNGSRSNAINHVVTAIEHGFNYAVVNAPVIIADGLKGNDYADITIHQRHFNTVKIAQSIVDAHSMIVVSHVKGHEMAGFGGAIKNLAMGCAPIKGKMEQHSARPVVNPKKCIGCSECATICPANAITIAKSVASINPISCIGCGECISICPQKTIHLNWETELPTFIERMTEYALGAVQKKQKKTIFINFLMNISPLCDCYPFNDIPIVPDIGILASTDAVAIDQASIDLINKQIGFENSALTKNHHVGGNKFKGVHDHVDGTIQLRYGQEIGLGTTDYKLISV